MNDVPDKIEIRFPNPCLTCTRDGGSPEDPPCDLMFTCLPFLNASIPEAEYIIRRHILVGDISHYMLQSMERQQEACINARARLLQERKE